MTDLVGQIESSIRALTPVDALIYWALTLAAVIAGECYFARYGNRDRRFYKRIFDSLHWLVAFGPVVLFFAPASYLEGKSWRGTSMVLGFLGFFATVHILERFHEAARRHIAPHRDCDP